MTRSYNRLRPAFSLQSIRRHLRWSPARALRSIVAGLERAVGGAYQTSVHCPPEGMFSRRRYVHPIGAVTQQQRGRWDFVNKIKNIIGNVCRLGCFLDFFCNTFFYDRKTFISMSNKFNYYWLRLCLYKCVNIYILGPGLFECKVRISNIINGLSSNNIVALATPSPHHC